MLAYDLLEARLCPDCSAPTALAWGPDGEGWWEADTDTDCASCGALIDAVKDQKDHDRRTKIRVRHTFDDETALALIRASFDPNRPPVPTGPVLE